MSDDSLVDQLADLAVVEIDALLSGAQDEDRAALAAAHAAELERALGAARDRMAELEAQIRAGGDPLGWAQWPPARRAGEDGARAAANGSEALVRKSAVCRELARLADIMARVAPGLVVADRAANGLKNS